MISQDLASHTAALMNHGSRRYERVASRISELIEHGTLRPGERVPSVRRYSEQEEVSISTVMQAYRLLESRGFIEARPQSGYYVRAQRWTPPPEPAMYWPKPGATNVRVSDLVLEVVKAGRAPGMVALGAALPNPELYPLRELNRVLAGANRRFPQISHGYTSLAGDASLRLQLAQRAMEAGCTLSPDDLVVTTGATEALHLCLRAVAKPGDTIAIETPTYFGILQTIESLGMKVCEVPTYPREGICLDELEKRLKCCRIKACVFTLNFSNPLGSCMPDEKKKRLVQMLTEHEVPLIEDDIYGNLSFAPKRPKSAKAFDTEGWVMSCDSLSKTLAPGFRIGWVAPGRFKTRVEFLKLVTTHSTASPTQLAMAEYLRNGGYENHLRKLRKLYATQAARMGEAVSRHFPEGTKVSRPTGGMALWVEMPESIHALEVYQRALAEKICVAPGPIFSAKQGFQNCLRLNYANPWSDSIERALVKLGQIIATLGGKGRS